MTQGSDRRPPKPPLMPPNPRPLREGKSNLPEENNSVTEVAFNPNLSEQASDEPSQEPPQLV